MYRNILLALAGLLAAAIAAAADTEIYKKELPDGSVIYTDQPDPDAERVEPSEPQVIPSFRPAPQPQTRPETETAFHYQRLEITMPSEEQSIWSDPGVLEVGISLEPALRSNHTLRILMDDEVVTETSSPASRFILNNVFRGTHILKAVVATDGGKLLIESSPVTFYMKQHSILSPTRPQ